VNEDGSITVVDTAAPIKPRKPSVTWVAGGAVLPDAKYQDLRVAKFINCLMYDGKKSDRRARHVYDAMEEIANKLKLDPLGVFHTALDNAMPMVEVKSKRVGGANYQVPRGGQRKRAQTLAVRWILEAVRGRKGRPTQREAGPGTDRLLQQAGRHHPEAREYPSHGRGQQGLQPLRLSYRNLGSIDLRHRRRSSSL
jgi:small subunit ribosomal protein S7